MKSLKRIGTLALVTLLSLSVQYCSGGDGDGSTSPTDGFSFYLDFSEPMDANFPEGSQAARLLPFSLVPSSAHATADPGRHIILWNVAQTVPFYFMRWESQTRMLVSFGAVPATTPVVLGGLNPDGKANGFRTAVGLQIPETNFQVPNDDAGVIPAVQIKVQF